MKQAAADAAEQIQPASALQSGAHFALTDDLLAGRFFSIDVRGHVTGWNTRAEAAFGWPTHHISGESLFDKLIAGGPGFGPPDVEQFFAPDSAGAGRRVRVLVAHQAGSQLPVELAIVPIELAKAYELNAFLQDVSTSTASGVASEIGRIREEHADVLEMIAGSLEREPGAGDGEEVRLAGALVVFHIDATAGTSVGSAPSGGATAAPADNPPASAGDHETARAEAERVRAQIDAALAEAEQARAEAEAARRERDDLQARIDAGAGDSAGAEEAAEAARREAEHAAEAARRDAEQATEAARSEVEELRTQAEQAGARAAESESAAEQSRAELSQARSDAERLTQELATAQAELAQAAGERDALRAEVAELRSRVEVAGQIESALAEAREQVAALDQELTAARADARSAEDGNAAANAELDQIRKQADEAEHRAQEADGRADEAAARADRVEAELATAREQTEALGADLAAAREQAETLDADLAAARDDSTASDSTAIFERVFDSAAIGLAIKADGRFTRVNQALCELIGRDAGALLALDPVDLVHRDERKAHKATEKSLRKGDITSSYAEARLIHADGSDVHVRETTSLLDDGTILAQFEPAAADAHVGVEEPPPAPPFVAPEVDDVPEAGSLPVAPESETTSTDLAPTDGLIDRLRQALVDDGFLLFAQPIIDLRTSEVTQYELLLRMREDSGRLLLPDKFLPAAHSAGLMQQIDQWVVRQAIGLIHAAAVDGKRLMLEVNISADSLDSDALTATIEGELDATGIDPRLLVIEVTEGAALEKIEAAIKLSKKLRAMGCRFAIDDFGSTFATVKYLKDMAVDYFKLDGDLIVTLPESRTNQLLLNALMDVARGTGTQTIAVYVPDDETLVMLRQYGIGYGQGNRVGRPRPVDEI